MSDTPNTDQTDAEPVEAEFEPAPGSTTESNTDKASKPGTRLPWLTIALVTVFAGAIGGGSGWLIGRYAPDAGTTALEDRIAALEAAAEAPADADQIAALQGRLDAVESSLQAAELRAQGIEQLVRDVANLRNQMDALTADGAPEAGDAGADTNAMAALEARLDQALAALQAQFNTVSENADTARAIADQAQAAIQQALSLISQGGADVESADAGPSDAASRTALAAVEARVAALEAASQTLAAQAQRLSALEQAVSVLSEADPDTSGVEALSARISQLETGIAALQAAAPGTEETASLAERAVAFAALSRAAAGPAPFPVAFADLQRLWPQAPGLSPLAGPARTGAPTLDQLKASFPGDGIRAVTGEAQLLFGVIRVERDATAGPTPAIEAALDAGNLAGAVAATEALDDEARAAASVWLSQAQARLAVEDSLSRLSEALAGEGGAQR